MTARLRIGVPRESAEGEGRVALVPDVVRSLRRDKSVDVLVGTGAGTATGFTDEDYESAGAEIVWDEDVWRTDLLLCVNVPSPESIARHSEEGTLRVLIGHLDPWVAADTNRALAEADVTAIAVEAIPHTRRAQGMDAVSSQAAAAGYAAMLTAARESLPVFTMLTGAAPPARVLVLGGGASCMQALSTARSLGATATGCDADSEAQKAHHPLAAGAADWDVIVTAALPPDRSPPLLVTAAAVKAMAPGSVIIDLAAGRGGNCELTECGKTVIEGGVKVIGPRNIVAEMPVPASYLYAQNLERLLGLLLTADGRLNVDLSDEILAAACITDGGMIRHRMAAGGDGRGASADQSILKPLAGKKQPAVEIAAETGEE